MGVDKFSWEYHSEFEGSINRNQWFLYKNDKMISYRNYEENGIVTEKPCPLMIIRLDYDYDDLGNKYIKYVLHSSVTLNPPRPLQQTNEQYGYMRYSDLELAKYDGISWYCESVKKLKRYTLTT